MFEKLNAILMQNVLTWHADCFFLFLVCYRITISRTIRLTSLFTQSSAKRCTYRTRAVCIFKHTKIRYTHTNAHSYTQLHYLDKKNNVFEGNQPGAQEHHIQELVSLGRRCGRLNCYKNALVLRLAALIRFVCVC